VRILNLSSLLFLPILLLCIFFSASTLYAQESKPKLVEIVVNKETNDPKALEVAKKLEPDAFLIFDGFTKPDFFAKYISLDNNRPDRFIIATAQNSAMYCTSYGCPYYIYENRGGNNWKSVATIQAHSLIYDDNKQTGPKNIIYQTFEGGQSQVIVSIWNGQYYERVNRR
jgi:hypothetical protein